MTIRRAINTRALSLATAALLAANVAHAQCTPGGPPSPAPVKGAIVGIVMDTAHRVIEGVDVIIKDPRRNVRTDANGRFVITDLVRGENELTVRRLGYEIAVQKIAVTDSGGVARFCLIPEPRGLPAVITSVPRGGLSGVIGDSTYNVLPGAEVKAVAGGAAAITDSAGGFYLPLKKGTYAVMVKKAGFGSQLLSVTIPNDSGRKIAVWLSSPPRNARRIAAAIEDSMKFRLMMARPSRARLLSSEDLTRNSGDLTRVVQAAAIARVSDNCEAVVDGGPFVLPLYAIDKSEIAAVEVYAIPPARNTVTSLPSRGKASARSSETPTDCNVRVYVWLKP